MTSSASAHLVYDHDATCDVSGCSRPDGGTLTLGSRCGGFRVSACEEHGWRATQGEWFVFDVLGRKVAMGGGVAPPHYSPLRADPGGGESFPRPRRRQHLAALRAYDLAR